MSYKNKITILTLLAVFLVVGLTFYCQVSFKGISNSLIQTVKNFQKFLITKKNNKPIAWMNVFIHGTVGTAFFILNMSALSKDEIDNTNYKKMSKSLRKNHSFYQDQPILGKGLVQITPSYEFEFSDNAMCYGAYPVLKAFDDVLVWKQGEVETQFYYLFGWSGYISQKKRRLEALRCYNQLVEEAQKLKKAGFIPKIRVLAHSHGGNVALNMAGFFHMLNPCEETQNLYKSFEMGPIIKDTFDGLLERLPEQDIVAGRKNQKKYDHLPVVKNFFIDELILLGTPIQEETSLFVMSPFFGDVYNFYSDGDMVQSVDFLSTVKKQSFQRMDGLDTANKNFFQVKVTIVGLDGSNKNSNPKKTMPHPTSWWQLLLGLKDTSRKTADPTHKEFWFIVADDNTPFNFLRPVPLVCFYPIFRDLQKKASTKDCELEISKSEAEVFFKLTPKINDKAAATIEPSFPEVLVGQSCQQDSLSCDKVKFLQEKLHPWSKNKNHSKAMKSLMEGVIKLHRKINI